MLRLSDSPTRCVPDGGKCPSSFSLLPCRPLLAATLVGQAAGDRRHVIDAVGLAIAGLLPDEYRGVYRDERFPDAARVLRTARV
jgi:hypothetical protein